MWRKSTFVQQIKQDWLDWAATLKMKLEEKGESLLGEKEQDEGIVQHIYTRTKRLDIKFTTHNSATVSYFSFLILISWDLRVPFQGLDGLCLVL